MSPKPAIPLCAVLLAACPAKQDQPAEQGAVLEQSPQRETPSTKAHMQDHFSKAEEIKAALIAGNLERAREPARWMAEHQANIEHPDAWKPYVQSMRDAAQRIGGTKELPAATHAFVDLAEVCAQCHAAIGGPKIHVGKPPEPADSANIAAHMIRHQWALDAMWQGLIGPSKDAWVAGAEVLAEAPLTPEVLTPGQSVAPAIEQLATRVHELGNQARNVPDAWGIPRRIYGDLLTTCETCHGALRRL